MAAMFSTKITNISQLFYQSLGSSRAPQEKADRILEPMQVMIQLALLSFCPTGTKLCVNNNLLSLQLLELIHAPNLVLLEKLLCYNHIY